MMGQTELLILFVGVTIGALLSLLGALGFVGLQTLRSRSDEVPASDPAGPHAAYFRIDGLDLSAFEALKQWTAVEAKPTPGGSELTTSPSIGVTDIQTKRRRMANHNG